LVLYALAPAWARASLAHFDRDLVRLLSSGRREALGRCYARALGMRLFAPPALIAERRALVAAELGETREARVSFRRALAEYGPDAPLRVMLGYAHACYALCDDDEAIRMYERLLQGTGELPGVKRNLAHAYLRAGQDAERALALLGTTPLGSEDPRRIGEHVLLRALAYAKLGEAERARSLTRDGEKTEGGLAECLRDEIERALFPTAAPVEPC
jgi:tetratricopeptide (TPR) repeat protein